MAELFPPDAPAEPPSERKVHQALANLGPGWKVFPSVSWQSVADGRPGDGEADFVVVHPGRGLLVVEVKGGGISVEKGRWWSTDRTNVHHEIKNPFLQAVRSKHALVKYLRSVGLGGIRAGHVVWFPDLKGVHGLGPAAPSELILDRESLSEPATAMDKAFVHWELATPIAPPSLAALTQHLAPTTTFRPLMRDVVEEVNKALETLTLQQIGVLRGIRRNRRALIYGGAGTGKTVLAVAQARALAAAGFRTLLTCYNSPLGKRLAADLADQPTITAASFHSLCHSQARRAGFTLPSNPPAVWWDIDLPNLLPDAALANGTSFDAVVVDEGQDFPPNWFAALSLLLGDEASSPTYVFADVQQAIYVNGWGPPFEGAAFDLELNCRNSGPIADVVGRVFDDEVAVLRAEGPAVELIEAETDAQAQKGVLSAVGRLLTVEKLRRDQLVVLSPERSFVDALRSPTSRGRFGGIEETASITAETVHRFKGLEADGVVLHVPSISDLHARRLAYIGASRARAHLTLVGPERVLNGLKGISGSDRTPTRSRST